MKSRNELRAGVLAFIERGFDRPAPDEFEELALAVFRHQFEQNEPYRRYCERRGASPDSLSGWSEVPAVPTAAFKEAALICGGAGAAEQVFRTSGTTQGSERRGAHYIRDLALYQAAAGPNFQRHLLPEQLLLSMLILAMPPPLARDSSLTWMLELVRREYGADDSDYYIDEDGLRVDALVEELTENQVRARPVCLLGTAAALWHLLERLVERNLRFSLPAGSRVMETGGFKGGGKEIGREVFYSRLIDTLGLSPFYIVAEYGMTEMCSQFYDNVLHERARARSPDLRHKVIPPWVRTRAVDAETLQPLAPGEVGVLRHFDLANLDSVSAIQTDDLGVEDGAGFEILGRASGAELRGCSIAIDQWLAAQR